MKDRRKLVGLTGILGVLALLQGCTKEGACEYGYTSFHYYACDNVSDSSIFPPSSSDVCFYGDVNHLHENTSCSSIGYSINDGSDYIYNSSYDASPYGAFGSGSGGSYGGGSGSSGGSGGSSGGSLNCDTVWTGSPSDIQVSTECQAACVYYNSGNQQGVNSACDIVAGYGATSSCTVCH